MNIKNKFYRFGISCCAVYLLLVSGSAGALAEQSDGFFVKDNPGALVTLKDVGIRLPGDTGEITFYGKNQTRLYVWDYFASVTDNDYAHAANKLLLGTKWSNEWFDAHAAFQYTEVQFLPSGVSAGAGTGSLYRVNGDGTNDPHGTYLKYLSLDVKDIWDIGLTGSVGRFDYSNAGNYQSSSKKIEWVKSKRVSERVLGGFGWSEFERSFDGVKLNEDMENLHLSFAAFSPTQGGFEERAGRGIDGIDVLATEVTLKENPLIPNSELQFFYYHYDDSRLISTASVRRDNTGRSIGALSEQNITMDFFGGHLIGTVDAGPGQFDYLLWGGYQSGEWYELDHQAYTFVAEAGYQFKDLPWTPWIRGGYNVGSGDNDPSDGDHETFFQMLPTARLYSWSLLYNMMNTEDTFLMLILKPFKNVVVRSDIHWVSLDESADRWYLGSGPTSLNNIGGYASRASSGNDLGTLFDVGVWWNINPDVIISAYYGYFSGEEVVENFFTTQKHNNFAYMDLTVKF